MATSSGLQTLLLSSISPNRLNPRKTFDAKALDGLADSIRVHGVRQPVLVRPMLDSSGFQLVVGERRWRASKIAGKKDIPAIVDPSLSDAQALEIMVIENLQREDVSPLDEALGYEALLQLPGAEKVTVEAIAAKVGKSIGYVYARCKLLALIPAGREALGGGFISVGHAVLVARLQPGDQVKAILACFSENLGGEGDFKDHDPQKIAFSMLHYPEAPLLPEKALREWIQDNVNLKLKGVPWDLADAELVPEAGSCALCPKRSGSNPALFADLTVKGEDTCFDAGCFNKKRQAFVDVELYREKVRARMAAKNPEKDAPEDPLRQLSEQTAYTLPKPDQKLLKAGQWLPAKKGECANVETGMIVRGDAAGEKRLVCCNSACKVHKHNLSKPAKVKHVDPEQAAAEQAKDAALSRVGDKLIEHVLQAAIARVKKPDAATLRLIAIQLFADWYGNFDHVFAALGLKAKVGDLDPNYSQELLLKHFKTAGVTDLLRAIYLSTVAEDLAEWAPEFKLLAKFGNVDIAKTRKALEKGALKGLEKVSHAT